MAPQLLTPVSSTNDGIDFNLVSSFINFVFYERNTFYSLVEHLQLLFCFFVDYALHESTQRKGLHIRSFQTL